MLKKGKTAFKGEPETGTYFHGQDVKFGDWVVIRPGDARRVQINGVDCPWSRKRRSTWWSTTPT
ncbi:hypothetical protein J6524_18625 [Bradyrhizobium sp. WSM 1738]|uniref:hypothetical protein n=1 Tax=Bradyrhizobium hereditatis TaxID=2821405 RepID=UPI001CE302CC|nr:hypothetical protein [Bradyrhizobium hereditatis]MCA6116883.1 hypothetical protein [Bradyrhizobium hereditatis]